jgi:hypothetical protein
MIVTRRFKADKNRTSGQSVVIRLCRHHVSRRRRPPSGRSISTSWRCLDTSIATSTASVRVERRLGHGRSRSKVLSRQPHFLETCCPAMAAGTARCATRASRAVSQQQYHLPNVLQHRADLGGSPAMVPTHRRRMALHRAGKAYPERLRRELHVWTAPALQGL